MTGSGEDDVCSVTLRTIEQGNMEVTVFMSPFTGLLLGEIRVRVVASKTEPIWWYGRSSR